MEFLLRARLGISGYRLAEPRQLLPDSEVLNVCVLFPVGSLRVIGDREQRAFCPLPSVAPQPAAATILKTLCCSRLPVRPRTTKLAFATLVAFRSETTRPKGAYFIAESLRRKTVIRAVFWR